VKTNSTAGMARSNVAVRIAYDDLREWLNEARSLAFGPNAKCWNVRYCAAVGAIADMTKKPSEDRC
jgi:hypothetical protein